MWPRGAGTLADRSFVVEAEDRGRRVQARVQRLGPDVVVAVGGGTHPHVGCVVLATARPSTTDPSRQSCSSSVLTVAPHKEEPVARAIAERIAPVTGGTVVVTAGIHEDGLDRQGIRVYLDLAARLADEIVSALTQG